MHNLILFIAWRYLRSRKKQGFISLISWFSLIGVMVGVATLIIVMSVMNGFHASLLNTMLGMSGHLSIQKATESYFTDYDPLIQKLTTLPGIQFALPTIDAQAMYSAHNDHAGVMVRGLEKEDMKKMPLLSSHIIQGNIDQLDHTHIMIGNKFAQKIGLTIGDSLSLITPEGKITAFGTMPRIKTYFIGAIYEIGSYEYDHHFIFMPLKEAQNYFGRQGIDKIDVFLTHPENLQSATQDIFSQTSQFLYVTNWKDRYASLSSALIVERNVMFIILTLIIIVAALNIISSITMLVSTKNTDIGILRTMGAPQSMILKIFFLCGSFIGGVGTLLGAVIGTILAYNLESLRLWIEKVFNIHLFPPEIYYLSAIPSQPVLKEILMICFLSCCITFLATFFPSLKAARLHPVEALKHG